MHSLARIIHAEIAERGPIPFNRFMELALYCPELGFYEKEGDNVGQGGDFYTSVSVGPLFGELLAFRFAKWLEEHGAESLQIVEAGAHDGKLAGDILGWLQRQRPEVLARTKYCILEPSTRRCEWQRARLGEFVGKVMWLDHLPDCQSPIADRQFTVVFSNELLDALPVRRFGWDAAGHKWFEWGVASAGEQFIWTRLALLEGARTEGPAGLPTAAELLDVLPDGYTVELCPAAETWWANAARGFQVGKLVTFDYGFTGEGWLQPERPNGTLRAYHQHRVSNDILNQPGEQDLTAHVNFARLEAVGLAAGLKTDLLESQARFLTGVAAEVWKADSDFGAWDQKRTRQFQTLTHPDHLGSSFRALVQSRG